MPRPTASCGNPPADRPRPCAAAVLDIVAERGQDAEPGDRVRRDARPAWWTRRARTSPLGLAAGDRIATLVSLSLTPLALTDGLARWDGQSEQVPCAGHAILFGRSIAAVLPADLPAALALAVMDVCGAPALTERVVRAAAGPGRAGSGPGRGHPRRGRQERLPVRGGRPPGRRGHGHRRGARPRRRPPRSAGRPRRPGRDRGRPGPGGAGRRRPVGGRPGRPSPWCAWTCPAARAVRCWPPRRAAR